MLHTNVVTGELSPGERLVEEELAEQLQFSRGTVRSALLRLEHEGLGSTRGSCASSPGPC